MITFTRFIPALGLLILFGCLVSCGRGGSSPRAEKAAIDSFDAAARDFEAACATNAISPFPVLTSSGTYYKLPASVDPLIRMGTTAIPLLTVMKHSSNLTRSRLASTCIEIIQAKEFEKGESYKDERSGIVIVSYVVVRSD